MFLVDLDRWLRMRIAIMLGGQAEDERHQNKNDDAPFFRSENELLPKQVES